MRIPGPSLGWRLAGGAGDASRRRREYRDDRVPLLDSGGHHDPDRRERVARAIEDGDRDPRGAHVQELVETRIPAAPDLGQCPTKILVAISETFVGLGMGA